MQTQNSNKREYNTPIISQIQLDNEISLALDSTPPTYETLNGTNVPEYFNNNPIRDTIV